MRAMPAGHINQADGTFVGHPNAPVAQLVWPGTDWEAILKGAGIFVVIMTILVGVGLGFNAVMDDKNWKKCESSALCTEFARDDRKVAAEVRTSSQALALIDRKKANEDAMQAAALAKAALEHRREILVPVIPDPVIVRTPACGSRCNIATNVGYLPGAPRNPEECRARGGVDLGRGCKGYK